MASTWTTSTPWARVGDDAGQATRVDDAVRRAGIDWETDTVPVCTPEGVEIPGYAAVGRVEDGAFVPTAVVSSGYRVNPNRAAFSALDTLRPGPDWGVLRHLRGGDLGEGRGAFLLSAFTRNIVTDCGDEVSRAVVSVNGHDGERALTIAYVPIHATSGASLPLELPGEDRRSVSVAHTSSQLIQAELVSTAARIFEAYDAELRRVLRLLTSKRISWAQFEHFADAFIPIRRHLRDATRDRDHENQEKLRDLYASLPEAEGTAWGALVAWAGYLDWAVPTRPKDSPGSKATRAVLSAVSAAGVSASKTLAFDYLLDA